MTYGWLTVIWTVGLTCTQSWERCRPSGRRGSCSYHNPKLTPLTDECRYRAIGSCNLQREKIAARGRLLIKSPGKTTQVYLANTQRNYLSSWGLEVTSQMFFCCGLLSLGSVKHQLLESVCGPQTIRLNVGLNLRIQSQFINKLIVTEDQSDKEFGQVT